MKEQDTKPVAVIVGAGSKYTQDSDINSDTQKVPATMRWGLGGALSQRFAKDYTVVLMGRREEKMAELVTEIESQGGRAIAVACDVTDTSAVRTAFDRARLSGDIEVLVYNAAPPYPPGVTFDRMPLPHEVPVEHLQFGFDVGVTGCLRCVQEVIKPMQEAGRGTILLTGATQALRGAASFASMSPIKFALRSLGQSLFQAYAPQGIHVAHVVIDGPIDSPGIRTQLTGQDTAFLDPGEIADAYVMLANQPRSCWSYELQLTPNRGAPGMRL